MGIIIATLIVLLVSVSALAQDFTILSWDYWQEGGSDTSRSEVFRNFLLALIALGALIVGSARARSAHRQADAANAQARIAEQGHFTDRFSTAIDHLGNEQLSLRLGGIYALWRLAQDSPKRDLISVIDILCAFVRDPPHKTKPTSSDLKVRLDVQTVLDFLGGEPVDYRQNLPADYWLDLTSADLGGGDLRGANFSKTDFRLTGLREADLEGANLTDASLKFARLNGANLSGAILMRANLESADLSVANLRDAILSGADLTRAKFRDTNLLGADLSGANLSNANLVNAENLTQEQLDSACISKGSKPPGLPDGMKPPHKECRPLTR